VRVCIRLFVLQAPRQQDLEGFGREFPSSYNFRVKEKKVSYLSGYLIPRDRTADAR